VTREGEVAAGDSFTAIERDEHNIKVADITRLYARDKDDLDTMRRALEVEALPQGWRDYFRQKMNEQ
jgi:MOSC domain-containing protein YiiM